MLLKNKGSVIKKIKGVLLKNKGSVIEKIKRVLLKNKGSVIEKIKGVKAKPGLNEGRKWVRESSQGRNHQH